MIDKNDKTSPMMRHYENVKEQYKDCILFYRLGDFYELFNEDAIEISKVLDLTLTGKNCGREERAPMCGVPYHAAEGYIAKLVQMGYKVAICEQLTDPKPGQIVERDVIKVVTPGTVTEDSMLDERKNNYIMCLYKERENLAISYSDITTGEVHTYILTFNLEANFTDIFTTLTPSEVIGNREAKEFYNNLPLQNIGNCPKFEEYYEYVFNLDKCKDNILKQFGDNAIQVFELKNNLEMIAIGVLMEYLNETQKRSIKNINKIIKHLNENNLTIDMNTRRNLELVESIRERKKYGSLLWLLDKTKTSMGARRFRENFDKPSKNSTIINERLDSVEELTKNLIMRDRLSESLKQIYDIERISGKIGYGDIMPKDIVNLRTSLEVLPEVKNTLKTAKSKKLVQLRDEIEDFSEIAKLLKNAIKEQPPAVLREGGYIEDGFNEELDELRSIKSNGKEWIKELEKREREETGIKTLKIGYNSVFGYYIEVSKLQSELVPLRYQRRQTLANNERYITTELAELEEKIETAEEKIIKLERKIYTTLVDYLVGFIKNFQKVSKIIAEIDMILSFAEVAVKNNFVRPVINKNVKSIKIVDGRHPIVEQFVKNSTFITNDTLLDCEDNKMMIITGPNMAGKSTYMRQVALITFMAHLGSFVPAKSAEISITDRIFTRVGASDDLAFGQSTFMVEMSEVANILANATKDSLVVLDEIGRGTSTFDGLSIAWAVVEYIAKNLKCKTLFATHYHELSELEGVISGVKNYKITVKEIGDKIVFLRKIIRGHASKSFGVEVAELAGVPEAVIERAKEISKNLEKVNQKLDLNIFSEDEEKRQAEKNSKLGLKLLSILKDIDMNRVSPMESFEILNDLVEKSKE